MIYFYVLLSSIGICLTALMLFMIYTSLLEKRKHAIAKALYTLPITLSLAALPFYLPNNFNGLVVALDITIVSFACYLFIPRFLFSKKQEAIANGNIDERTIMFSRKELKPDTERFNQYYNKHPEHKETDNEFRKAPGLLSPRSTFYNPLAYQASDAIFRIVDGLHNFVDGPKSSENHNISTDSYVDFITKWTLKSGAISVGFTTMKDYHWYSTGGRGKRYGMAVDQSHKIGIAFTVEMDQKMVEAAPKSSIIMESATQYLQAGIIATQLAQFIRNMGFDARAHIDGNYGVVAPLVARDANLGEIGRMGLLMTPELGPRVRVGVVTTNLTLPVTKREYDDSYEDFCEKCLKCAENCPGKAISIDSKQEINNVKRWQINSEKCFNYWCIAGTDCGRCMSTCPYSHPNNLLHNTVRWSIRNFPNFRYWAVKMDDFFYGRKSSPAKIPHWMSPNEN